MRFAVSLALAGNLLCTGPVAAACLGRDDHAAFDVIGLKTQLMITALTCRADERYNEFVKKYRPALARGEKTISQYFSRVYGRTATKRHDEYVTELANRRSNAGLRFGTGFCAQSLPTFDQVMALRDGEFHQFAAGQGTWLPPATQGCAGRPGKNGTRTAGLGGRGRS